MNIAGNRRFAVSADRRSGCRLVATDCETCKWQIEMSTPAKVKHPISILAEALDLEATRKLNSDK